MVESHLMQNFEMRLAHFEIQLNSMRVTLLSTRDRETRGRKRVVKRTDEDMILAASMMEDIYEILIKGLHHDAYAW